MSYRFQRDEPLPEGVRRIAKEQIDKALAELDDYTLDVHTVVHQVRKRCKKLRGLLRIVRPHCEEAYQQSNAVLRDAARRLSAIRDATSSSETFDDLTERLGDPLDNGAAGAISSILESRRCRIAQDGLSLENGLSQMRTTLKRMRRQVPDWPVDELEFAAVVAGVEKTYGRGRAAMRAARKQPTVARYHEWRKRVKYHWYHTRLLRDLWKPVMGVREDQLKMLADHLGDTHDLANLAETLRASADPLKNRDELEAVLGEIELAVGEHLAPAQPLGKLLFAEKPKYLARRLRKYWNAWQQLDNAPQAPEEFSSLIEV